MKIPLAQIPDKIIAEYVLKNKVHSDGAVYIEIRKGMYGLPQAGMLAYKLLKRRLAKHGYYEVHHTPGYWRHMWRPIDFTPYIYTRHYANITKPSLSTGQARCIVALP